MTETKTILKTRFISLRASGLSLDKCEKSEFISFDVLQKPVIEYSLE